MNSDSDQGSDSKNGFRFYDIPKHLENWIWKTLELNHSLPQNQSAYKKLAQDILRMSDFYKEHPGAPTPWDQDWCVRAQLVYFLPLNYIRARSVVQEVQKLGFLQSLKSALDIGSGLGPVAQAFSDFPIKFSFLEISDRAYNLSKSLNPAVNRTAQVERADLVTLSYSFTEDLDLESRQGSGTGSPDGPQLQSILGLTENLILIEPSLKADSQKLIQFRERMIAKGWFAWAPCVHQQSCPFLDSAADWCHDRIHFQAPHWFRDLEKHLPIKNENLSFSYLALSRRPPPQRLTELARTTGDFLEQKGKSKISICRSSQKESLSWLHRNTDQPPLSRGSLIELPLDLEDKGLEKRTKSKVKVFTNF